MKIYTISITVAAVIALTAAVFFYAQNSATTKQTEIYKSEMSAIQNQLDSVQSDLNVKTKELKVKNDQIDRLSKTVKVLRLAGSSFMFPGDYKAITVGSKEAAEVSEAIASLYDNGERMMAEKHWSDFTKSLRLNDVFGLIRNLLDGMDNNLQQTINQDNTLQPLQ